MGVQGYITEPYPRKLITICKTIRYIEIKIFNFIGMSGNHFIGSDTTSISFVSIFNHEVKN